jgi:hypothetical protein
VACNSGALFFLTTHTNHILSTGVPCISMRDWVINAIIYGGMHLNTCHTWVFFWGDHIEPTHISLLCAMHFNA